MRERECVCVCVGIPRCVRRLLVVFSLSVSVPPLQNFLSVFTVHPHRADGRVGERVCARTHTHTHTHTHTETQTGQ